MKKERTFEITNFCEHNCKYCSSDSVDDMDLAIFLSFEEIENMLKDNKYDTIILSGGEPLAHPNFYLIYMLCKEHAKNVIVYSNLITHRIFNANVIDSVYLEANLTLLNNVERIHILKRIDQGREKTRPEVKFSRNYDEDCSCDHRVVKPDGSITKSPCNKDIEIDEVK
jgi:organic radical activating enzyme